MLFHHLIYRFLSKEHDDTQLVDEDLWKINAGCSKRQLDDADNNETPTVLSSAKRRKRKRVKDIEAEATECHHQQNIDSESSYVQTSKSSESEKEKKGRSTKKGSEQHLSDNEALTSQGAWLMMIDE